MNFDSTVIALVHSLIRLNCPVNPYNPSRFENEVVNFVLLQKQKMSNYLQWSMNILILYFILYSIVRWYKSFHRLNPNLRQLQIVAWRSSRLGIFRDFVRFFESLTLLGWYSFYETEESFR